MDTKIFFKMSLDLMVFTPEIIFLTYVINFDEYADAGTYWIALYVKNIEIIYFDNFGVEHVPKEIRHFIGN